MSMIENHNQKSWSWPSQISEQSKKNYYQRLDRLDCIKKDKRASRQKVLDEQEMNDYIKYAIETESKRLKDIKLGQTGCNNSHCNFITRRVGKGCPPN